MNNPLHILIIINNFELINLILCYSNFGDKVNKLNNYLIIT